MRRTLALLVSVVAVLGACGDDDDEAGAPSATAAPSAGSSSGPSTTAHHDGAGPAGAGAAGGTATSAASSPSSTPGAPSTVAGAVTTTTAPVLADQIPGMPPVVDAANVYSEAGPGELSPAVAGALPRVYVPGNTSGAVTVIDPATFEVLDRYVVGDLIQHVVPAWDLRTLYANASSTNELVPIDPLTAQPGPHIRVDAPYNLYFAPDGSSAIVMAERRNRIDWYDPVTWERSLAIDVPCDGPNHADWTADGRWFVVTCEFSGQLLRVDTVTREVVDVLDLGPGAMPQDVRLVPDGSMFAVADQAQGLVLVDTETFTVAGLVDTGHGPHGVYPSRDARVLYVTNRHGGSIGVVDPVARAVVDTWEIPGGGSPDMGGVTADGSQLWVSGRYHDEVYVFDTATGDLLTRIPVPGEPHGLAVWPQPGRFSLGHTGNTR